MAGSVVKNDSKFEYLWEFLSLGGFLFYGYHQSQALKALAQEYLNKFTSQQLMQSGSNIDQARARGLSTGAAPALPPVPPPVSPSGPTEHVAALPQQMPRPTLGMALVDVSSTAQGQLAEVYAQEASPDGPILQRVPAVPPEEDNYQQHNESAWSQDSLSGAYEPTHIDVLEILTHFTFHWKWKSRNTDDDRTIHERFFSHERIVSTSEREPKFHVTFSSWTPDFQHPPGQPCPHIRHPAWSGRPFQHSTHQL